MAQVFISYSRKDKDCVRKPGDAFIDAKRDAWLDWKDIPLTSEWQNEIYSNAECKEFQMDGPYRKTCVNLPELQSP